jgi:hypothetical protein
MIQKEIIYKSLKMPSSKARVESSGNLQLKRGGVQRFESEVRTAKLELENIS